MPRPDDDLLPAEVEPLARVAALREKELGPDHPEVAALLHQLASRYTCCSQPAVAERLYRRALAIRERALGPEHPDVAHTLSRLAVLLDDQGQWTEAEGLYRMALSILRKTLGPRHSRVLTVRNNLDSLLAARTKKRTPRVRRRPGRGSTR